MRLIYKDSGKEVQVGDEVKIHDDTYQVSFFRKPYYAGSSGKVSARLISHGRLNSYDHVYFVSQ